MDVNINNKTERNDLAAITASITGVSARYVRYVINGERNNDIVFDTYMNLRAGRDSAINAAEKCFHELQNDSRNEID